MMPSTGFAAEGMGFGELALGFSGSLMQAVALNRLTQLDHRNRAHHMRRMAALTEFFWSHHFWAVISVLSGVAVLVSSLADRRRHRRSNINDVGFMPWTAITVFSVLAAVIAAALAIKT
jgi:hypothetical protein